ncbi:hypothetical protein AAF712_006285 [Marasmius tenuissimus]|uniref:Uncharacterized protein n=1 Tax=Marasmius tenuissimus TaxID=585030 RepID=A0ABR3A033_9AGAR
MHPLPVTCKLPQANPDDQHNPSTALPQSGSIHHRLSECLQQSDHIPSGAEKAELESSLKEVVRESCDRQIAVPRGRKRIAAVATARSQSALSALGKLPVEIWETVFSVVCLDLYEYSLDVSFGSGLDTLPVLETPTIALSQVCGGRRHIIQNVRNCGPPFALNSAISHGTSLGCYLCIWSCQAHPPIIHVNTHDHDESSPFLERIRMHNAWHVLSQHIPRCRCLITTIAHFDFPDLSGIPNLCFPNLETYQEEHFFVDEEFAEKAPWLLDALNAAPKLKRMVLWDIRPGIPPYHQLESLETHFFFQPRQLFDVLPDCTALDSLTFCGFDTHDIDGFTRDTELPQLRRLSIYEEARSIS